MGYCMGQLESKFAIKKENFDQVLAAIQGLRGKETCNDSSGPHFRWVEDYFYKINNLAEMFKEWRWELSFDEDGNVKGVEFTGEKYGDEEIFFKTIAPYVEAGSYIKMYGEEGENWTWCFDGENLKTDECFPCGIKPLCNQRGFFLS